MVQGGRVDAWRPPSQHPMNSTQTAQQQRPAQVASDSNRKPPPPPGPPPPARTRLEQGVQHNRAPAHDVCQEGRPATSLPQRSLTRLRWRHRQKPDPKPCLLPAPSGPQRCLDGCIGSTQTHSPLSPRSDSAAGRWWTNAREKWPASVLTPTKPPQLVEELERCSTRHYPATPGCPR